MPRTESGIPVMEADKARFFIDVGELWPEVFVTTGNISEKNILFHIIKAVMTYLYDRAERILCTSHQTVRYFQNRGYANKVVTMLPGLRIDKSFNVREEINKPDQFIVIYAGSFQPIYPIDKAIEAAKIVEDLGYKDIKFFFIGDGIQKKEMMSMAKNIGLNNIEFFAPIPKNELLVFLRSGSALLLIERSISYGCSNKLLVSPVASPISSIASVR